MVSTIDSLLLSTIQITGRRVDGASELGTGFFFRFQRDPATIVPAIVTNRHVVERCKSIEVRVTLHSDGNEPTFEKHHTFNIDDVQKRCIGHPDGNIDLSVILIGDAINLMMEKKTPLHWAGFGPAAIASGTDLQAARPGRDILLIGYPAGFRDKVNNVPVVRRGIIATSAARSFDGRSEFVIDAAVFGGSSGSPVILYDRNIIPGVGNSVSFGERALLLGVLYGGFQTTNEGVLEVRPIPTSSSSIVPVLREMIHLGACIHASRILDFESLLPQDALQGDTQSAGTHPTSV